MQSTASAVAAAALTFWALVGLADRHHQPQPSAPPPQPAALMPEPRGEWQHPDPRTLSRFPGP
jgi:hypothetical protein